MLLLVTAAADEAAFTTEGAHMSATTTTAMTAMTVTQVTAKLATAMMRLIIDVAIQFRAVFARRST